MPTVLVIEDEPAILALIQAVAENNGCAVLTATTAQEAFERFEENDAQVDLLITDVLLANSSGIRVALELRSLLPNLKMIVTSGYPPGMWNEQDRAELDEIPSDSVVVLQKPFALDALRNTIHRFIGLPIRLAPAMKNAGS